MKVLGSKKNQRGQGLVEYLIIVGLMGVATIGIVRVMSHTVQVNFTNITRGLQGDLHKVKAEAPTNALYQKRDLSDFLDSAGGPGDSGSAAGTNGSHGIF